MQLKLTALLLFTVSLHISARTVSQTVTLVAKEVQLKKVFNTIEKQTGYMVLYTKELLQQSKPVTLSVTKMPLGEFLPLLLHDQQLEYTIDQKTILISPAFEEEKIPEILPPPPFEFAGRILDETGAPIPGATVSVKGTQKGTSAAGDGRFVLRDIPEGSSIVISAIGFNSIEIGFRSGNPFLRMGSAELIGSGGDLTIRLKRTEVKLEDVVVTGYFNRKKESFTGASVSYTGAEIVRANPVNILAGLAALEPSFRMVENSLMGSNPNVIPDFVVRGEASLPDLEGEYKGNPNNPIFILDGFEVTAERIFDMDPALLGSVTILKDAASTAIYGSRASNGVVIIETKKPESGQINLTYNLDMSYTTPDLRDYQLLNAEQKLELEKAAGFYDLTGNVANDEKRIDEYNEKLRLIRSGNNTYWLNKPLQVAIGQKHSLVIDGGESSLRYSINVQYEKAPGVMIGSTRDRTGIATMLQYRFKNVTFQNRLSYNNVVGKNSIYGTFSQYARINPYFRYDNDQGEYVQKFETGSWFTNVANPLYNTKLNVIDETSYNEFLNNFSFDWMISPKLRLQSNLSFNQKKSEGVVFKPAEHTDFLNYNIPSAHRRGQYRSSEGKNFSYDGKIQLSYLNTWNKHVLNTGIAANIQEVQGMDYSFLIEGFPADKLDNLIFGLQYPEGSRPSGTDNISRLIGIVSSTNYAYDNRFLVDFSFRTDASSKFGADDRWAPFWSVGAGWNMHNEKMFADNGFVDKLRLRASYGITGSQSFNPYQSMTRYEFYMTDIYNYLMGATMKALGNRELQWQKTHQLNLGIDFTFLRNFDITANYYRKNSKNLLADITLPPSLGFSSYKENIGEMLNRGIELNAKAMLYKRGKSYVNLIVGIVRNVNTIEKISNSLQAWNEAQDKLTTNKPRVRYIEGQSINTIWGVPSVGINPASGREIFITPDGKRTDIWSPLYQQPIGVTDPDFEGNVGLNAAYEGLQLSLYFRYRSGGQMYNSTLVERVENANKQYNTDIRVLEERWQNPGDITLFKDVRDNAITQATSRFVEDYSFMQLTTMNVSYDFPKSFTDRLKMKTLRLSFTMNDVFRVSTVKIERGIEYPFAASFRTSLRVMF
ncbi:MAG TPA: SusC/RagA family TonB-linked outer membrane protein [Parasegetibacter sp.]